jgi:hypothetical protein
MSEFTATILLTSPRAGIWREVFGSETVPIVSPVPHKGVTPNCKGEFYSLDVARLTKSQRQRLVDHLVRAFKLTHADVERLIYDPTHGVPILAADLVVPLDLRLFT